MNIPNILKLAEVIEVQPFSSFESDSGFNMSHEVHLCGSPSCILGWAASLALEKDEFDSQGIPELDHAARKYLDIGSYQRSLLFYPGDLLVDFNYQAIGPKDAAKVLRHLAATGTVDWSILKEPTP